MLGAKEFSNIPVKHRLVPIMKAVLTLYLLTTAPHTGPINKFNVDIKDPGQAVS
uniref:Uncharacterized protein n=1 Tax=Arion vulgaris TaxID=1028688 RepID=A0A0B6Z6P2_9EUPU